MYYLIYTLLDKGFGSVQSEYWIGLRWLATMTSMGKWELRIILKSWMGVKSMALFQNFLVGDAPQYRLTLNEFDGNASTFLSPASFTFHSGQTFSTHDRDQDSHPDISCSQNNGFGGWWYRNCYRSNLNGRNIKAVYDSVQANSKIDDEITTIDEGNKLTSYQEVKMEMRKIFL